MWAFNFWDTGLLIQTPWGYVCVAAGSSQPTQYAYWWGLHIWTPIFEREWDFRTVGAEKALNLQGGF